MVTDLEKESWTVDQITKSEFFHNKLHEWGLIEIAHELEHIKGEKLVWELKDLNISKSAWEKVIHRGIKPVRVFAHPAILIDNPRRTAYYRMLSMVSQKSMSKVGLNVKNYEDGRTSLDGKTSAEFSKHLNKIISILIESDEKVDEREFDLWRGMAAGSQAQGSWQNTKGDKAEVVIKEIIEKRLREKKLIVKETTHGKGKAFALKDGRVMTLGSEPDVAIYKDTLIESATEIKGGIDTAGVLERFGAALKSLRRGKQERKESKTVLIMQEVSLTSTVRSEIKKSKEVIDYFFTIEEIISDDKIRNHFFTILEI